MTAFIPLKAHESYDVVIRHLFEGRCVAIPSEATYEVVASALNPDALAGLAMNQQPAVVLFDYAELFDWMPRLRGAGARLFRRLGPGPVVLRADGAFSSGLWTRLPAESRRLVTTNGLLAVRWPAHPGWSELRRAGLPLIAVSVTNGYTAEETAKLVGDQAASIVDAGPTQYGKLPSLVRVDGNRCVLERAGVLSQDEVDELAMTRIVFVCTGNTCRSPLAEAICTKLLADHLGCPPADLKQHGFCVQSAGLAAMMGNNASPDAVRVAADLGADLSRHNSRMITREMLHGADHLFGMTAGHCYTLESVLMDGMPLPRLLSGRFEDIADPIGGELADYRTCAHQILACLQARLPELLES